MTTIINTNIASMYVRRNIDASRSDLNTSVQRLSSGLHINSAKDDAAGLAIATRMDSQIRGMNVAIRNANDAISLSQTAEGGLSRITTALQRIRELAVQSSNSTNTGTDRNNLNAEATQLKAEIDRIANTTSFNGIKLLDGSFSSQAFQVGADISDTLTISSITDANLAALGSGSSSTATTTALASSLYVGPALNGDLIINGHTIPSTFSSTSNTDSANKWVSAINGETGITGVSAAFDGTTLTLTSTNAITISGLDPSDGFGFAAGTYNPTQSSGMTNLDISTASDSTAAISSIDAALTQVNTARATLGAIQNRFTSVVDNLQVSAENQSMAKSRITDADFASETAKLTRGQILQQASTAMLAQANSMPNNVLSLLRG